MVLVLVDGTAVSDGRPVAATTLSRAEASSEFVFLGLRLREGIEPAQFETAFGSTLEEAFPGALPRLLDNGLLVRNGSRLTLSERGLLLANQVLMHFI